MQELTPFTEERPWGWFREFVKNETATVKILFIKKGEIFSLQRHSNRSEFWKVLSGDADITIGDNVFKVKLGDEFEVPPDTNHRIGAPTNDVEILEICRGEYDENDIVRIEDKYGRT